MGTTSILIFTNTHGKTFNILHVKDITWVSIIKQDIDNLSLIDIDLYMTQYMNTIHPDFIEIGYPTENAEYIYDLRHGELKCIKEPKLHRWVRNLS